MQAESGELVTSIEELAQFLRQNDQAWWADKLDRDVVRIGAGDRYGLDLFLGHFGGVGSLNDLLFQPTGRHDEFGSLRNRAWQLADQARRELSRGDKGCGSPANAT